MPANPRAFFRVYMRIRQVPWIFAEYEVSSVLSRVQAINILCVYTKARHHHDKRIRFTDHSRLAGRVKAVKTP